LSHQWRPGCKLFIFQQDRNIALDAKVERDGCEISCLTSLGRTFEAAARYLLLGVFAAAIFFGMLSISNNGIWWELSLSDAIEACSIIVLMFRHQEHISIRQARGHRLGIWRRDAHRTHMKVISIALG